jgi:hypothetical protein
VTQRTCSWFKIERDRRQHVFIGGRATVLPDVSSLVIPAFHNPVSRTSPSPREAIMLGSSGPPRTAHTITHAPLAREDSGHVCASNPSLAAERHWLAVRSRMLCRRARPLKSAVRRNLDIGLHTLDDEDALVICGDSRDTTIRHSV